MSRINQNLLIADLNNINSDLSCNNVNGCVSLLNNNLTNILDKHAQKK